MPEKIFDIYPPKTPPFKLEEKSPKMSSLEYDYDYEVLPEKPRRKFSRKKIIIFLLLGILIIMGGTAYFTLSRAKIEIWPKTQTLNFKERIEVNTQKNQPDFSTKIFPGKIFEEELEDSQEFTSSGKISKTEKARGQIRVYNAYSDSSQVLVANTRFMSAEGKLFRSVEKVTIPGGKYDEKGKLTPGFLDVQVIAAEGGEEYNIGPSTFSIPGFAGTSKYTAFYGKSSSPMTGGFQGESFQVTQTDLDKAKDSLVKKLFEKGNSALRNKISSEFILLNEALTEEITETNYSVQAGAEAQTFNFQAKIRLKIITFKKLDLEKFAKEFISARIPQDEALDEESFWLKKKIQENSLKINYEFHSIDWKPERIILDLDFSAKIYPDINEDILKKAVLEKSLKETQILLTNESNIEKSEINLWPFWVRKIPQKEGKIEIKLNLEG